ncbi:hypothetical protein hmeg3_18210 [Herbaspirillum sp. meg3]|uniref:hypothetical protein n=1 Tax=Herbaspirillum sp. meg3 TaxID=2025949 RepID=UPI000B98F1E5|nr:hypothetical protein [Herbaspirillum sp. meg3]ASU40031.1 hypothetical protein hmeg3_18210 [Herbaspirillum sp. meg3]
MKKTGTVASLVLIGMMACSAAVAAPATTANPSLVDAGDATPFVMAKSHAQAGKASKVKPALDQKKFRYLDMVERKHPSSIRNAVIVYDHVLMRKKACDAHDPASVSECLGRPSV